MLKNMKIRSRMLLSYALIIAISMVASVTALVMLRSVGANLTSFYNNNYAVTTYAWTARRAMQAARADILRALLETDKDVTEQQVDSAKENLAAMRETFPNIRSTFKGDIKLVDQVEDILDEAIVYRDRIFELALANKNAEAFKIMKNDYVPRLNQMADLLTQISDTAGKNAKKWWTRGSRRSLPRLS